MVISFWGYHNGIIYNIIIVTVSEKVMFNKNSVNTDML